MKDDKCGTPWCRLVLGHNGLHLATPTVETLSEEIRKLRTRAVAAETRANNAEAEVGRLTKELRKTHDEDWLEQRARFEEKLRRARSDTKEGE